MLDGADWEIEASVTGPRRRGPRRVKFSGRSPPNQPVALLARLGLLAGKPEAVQTLNYGGVPGRLRSRRIHLLDRTICGRGAQSVLARLANKG